MLTFTTNKTANYTAVAGNLVRADVSAGGITVTLPASPATDDQVGVFLRDTNVGAGSNFVTISASQSIFGVGTSMKLFVEGDYVAFQYQASDHWVIVEDRRQRHVVIKEGNTVLYNNGGLAISGNVVTIRRSGVYQVNARFAGSTSGPDCGVDVSITSSSGAIVRAQEVCEAISGYTAPAVTAAGIIVCTEGDQLTFAGVSSNAGDVLRFSIAELSIP